MEDNRPIVTDPGNSMKVRYTDNSAKENDFYPKYQPQHPLYLDPAGQPYSQAREIEDILADRIDEGVA